MERRHVLPPFGTRVPKSLSAGATLAFAALLVNVALVEFFSWSGLAEVSRTVNWLPSPGFPNIPLIFLVMTFLWLFKLKRGDRRRPISPADWNFREQAGAIAFALPFFLVGMGVSFRVVGFLVELVPDRCQFTIQERERTLLRVSASGNLPTLLGSLALGTDPIILRSAVRNATHHDRLTTLRLLLANSRDAEDSLNALQYEDIRGRDICLKLLVAHTRRTLGFENGERLRQRFGEVMAEAARRRNLEVLEYLLAAGADPNQPNTLGKTALFELADDDHADEMLPVIQKLVEAGATLNCLNRNDLTPLMVAINYRQYETIQYLLRHGSPIWRMGNNAFTLAVQTGDARVVRILLENVADEQIDENMDRLSGSLSQISKGPARMEVVQTILNRLDPRQRGNFFSHLAWSRENDLVRFAVEQGYGPNLSKEWGQTILIASVQSGNEDLAAFLLDHGANVNQQDSEGHTALDYAETDEMKRLLRTHGGRNHKPVSHDCGC